jgi:hypothetical protein
MMWHLGQVEVNLAAHQSCYYLVKLFLSFSFLIFLTCLNCLNGLSLIKLRQLRQLSEYLFS